MVREIWQDIPGYEGYYQVSNQGNVRNIGYMIRSKWRPRNPPRIIKAKHHKTSGRRMVFLTLEGTRFTEYVGRLVLITFKGQPPDAARPYVVYRNGDPEDDQPGNLAWGPKWAADGWGRESPRPGRP